MHSPVANDNEMGCCQIVVWVRSFMKPDLFDNNVRWTIPLRFIWSVC